LADQPKLSALQQRIRRIVAEFPSGTDLALATRKDGGFNPERLARVLAAFDNRNPAAYDDYPIDYRHLRAAISSALAQIEHLLGPVGPVPGTDEPGVDPLEAARIDHPRVVGCFRL
jgi:hypothetical protein